MAEVWVETDKVSEFVDYCNFVAMYAECDGWDADRVRWLIFGTAQALQAASILALSDQDTSLAALQESENKWIEYLHSGSGSQPKDRIASVRVLFERATNRDLLVFDQGDAETLSLFFDMRDQFVHQGADGWSIEVSGLPRLISVAWRGLLARIESGGFRHAEPLQLSKCRSAVVRILEAIDVDELAA